MFKHSIGVITVIVLIILISCATGKPKPGTGGTGSAKKIEDSGHPPVPDGVNCYVCHKRDIPEYEFHRNYGNKCDECHDKNSWMAMEYPHPVWVLDRYHRTRCTRCHTKASDHDFTFYQCYGCHHGEEAIKKSHAQLNVDNISNCIACHESTEK